VFKEADRITDQHVTTFADMGLVFVQYLSYDTPCVIEFKMAFISREFMSEEVAFGPERFGVNTGAGAGKNVDRGQPNATAPTGPRHTLISRLDSGMPLPSGEVSQGESQVVADVP
jgi:hypothetical protein